MHIENMIAHPKTYKVSLACIVPHFFECEVEAENELNAFKIGRELFYEGKHGEIVKITPAEIMLDLSDEDAEKEIPIGAFVKETKSHGD